MKTLSSFLFLYLILSLNISLSQSGWIQQQSNTTNNLNDVFFINSMTGWCAGDSNSILRTSNGGIEWTVQLSSWYYKLSSVYFVNVNTGWCCGGITSPLAGGVIYKTTNSGTNWSTIYSLGGSAVNKLYFINENTGYRTDNSSGGFSTSGSVSKTTNGGVNWFGILGGQYEFTAVKFKDVNTGWAAGYFWSDVMGDSSVVFKTTNGGDSWLIKYREKGGMIKDISFNNNNKVWAAGKDSSILFSSDVGDNWVKQNTNCSRRFNSVFFINENTGWAAGFRYPDTTNIIKSTNGGASWFDLKNNYANTLNSIFFLNENIGWAAGTKYPGAEGLILKTTTGGLTLITNIVSQIPVKFELHQNYPNPFNPATVIRYDIPVSGKTSIKVYDQLGSEIAVLLDGYISAGSNQVKFNASDIASGVYFYKLVSGAGSVTKKMIYIR